MRPRFRNPDSPTSGDFFINEISRIYLWQYKDKSPIGKASLFSSTVLKQCSAVKVAFVENNKQANFSLGTKRGSKLFYRKCLNILYRRLQLILVVIVGLVTVKAKAPFVFFLIEGEKRSLYLKRVKALKSHSPNFCALIRQFFRLQASVCLYWNRWSKQSPLY